MSRKYNPDQSITNLTSDARALVTATADMADDRITDARQRLESALDSGRQIYQDLREKTTDGFKVADSFVHDNPYKSVGVAMLIGALLLLLFRRRD
ncbi:MAG: hypothetical protein ABI615_05725 [Chthoniobacterales bacterium]